jgi:hypothetical protein
MFAAKALVGVIVPLSFLAGASADWGLRLLGPGEGAPARLPQEPTREVRVVYAPSWSSTLPASALPQAVELQETLPATSVEDQARSAPGRTFIDINSASIAELNHMGAGRIGKAIARRRPYASIEDLLRKRVLTRADYELIRDKIAVR